MSFENILRPGGLLPGGFGRKARKKAGEIFDGEEGAPPTPLPAPSDDPAVIAERERIERRRRGRGGTILTSPAGALLGVPSVAPRLGGATILGG